MVLSRALLSFPRQMPPAESASANPLVETIDAEREGGQAVVGARRFYRPELDVLRFVAFLAVFFCHALPPRPDLFVRAGLPRLFAFLVAAASSAGRFGVDLFFALSAYLLTELMLREVDLLGRVDAKWFLVRRALRIWPLYFFFLGVAIGVLPWVLPEQQLAAKYRIALPLFVGNWAIVAWGYPAPSVTTPLWSISVEEQFYIAWAILMGASGRRAARLVPAFALALIAAATVTRIFLARIGADDPAVWANTLARLDPIALGALLAVLLRRRPSIQNVGSTKRVFGIGAASAALLVCGLCSGPLVDSQSGWGSLPLYPVAAIAVTAILFFTIGCKADNATLIFLGRISYGLYVYHLLAIHLVWAVADRLNVKGSMLVATNTVVGLGLTIACAVLSYRWLEAPMLRLKERFTYVLSRPA